MRCLVQFGLQRNINSAGDRREALFAAQFADPVVGVQRAEGNAHPQNHGDQSNQFSAHNVLLLSLLGARQARFIGGTAFTKRYADRLKKFPGLRSSLFRVCLPREIVILPPSVRAAFQSSCRWRSFRMAGWSTDWRRPLGQWTSVRSTDFALPSPK